ncbi:Ribonuclease E, partial [hydrothermal vent metagenome]
KKTSRQPAPETDADSGSPEPTAGTKEKAKAKPKSRPKAAAPAKDPKGPRTQKTQKAKEATKSQPAKEAAKGKKAAPKASKTSSAKTKEDVYKLLINAEEPEECRIAMLENGRLEAFYIETVSRERTKGNIYKGRVVSVETNLQAAFIDIGTGKNAFLPFSEIHPEYYSAELPDNRHWKDVNFKESLKIGQEMLVEVVKETTGNKGANITTFLSLPGRYVVLMPGSDSHGISRQIESQEQRKKLREMLESCKLPEGVGYIIRTASKGITKTALTKDVRFLIKLWGDIRKRGQSEKAPALVYGEQNIVTRFLRDHFTADIKEIQVDSDDSFRQVKDFMDLLPAAQQKKTAVHLHKGPRPLLNSHNIEEQIEQIYRPTVKLPSGGSIVINPTEALVAIDVNSGSTGRDKKFAETIFLANMEAAEELARQVRLRDLGGLIVIDFIDMRSAAHIREVEKKVKSSMKRDKAKIDFARISKFGLMQISRQRMGSPIAARNYVTCECCKGRGIIRSVETQALSCLRQIQTGISRKNIKTVHCRLPMNVSQYLLNRKRTELAELEKHYGAAVNIEIVPAMLPADSEIDFLKK